jgi:hypothetical protein
VPSLGPSSHGQQSGAALCCNVMHAVPAQGVTGILPIHLHGYAARVDKEASLEGVPADLAASQHADGDL